MEPAFCSPAILIQSRNAAAPDAARAIRCDREDSLRRPFLSGNQSIRWVGSRPQLFPVVPATWSVVEMKQKKRAPKKGPASPSPNGTRKTSPAASSTAASTTVQKNGAEIVSEESAPVSSFGPKNGAEASAASPPVSPTSAADLSSSSPAPVSPFAPTDAAENGASKPAPVSPFAPNGAAKVSPFAPKASAPRVSPFVLPSPASAEDLDEGSSLGVELPPRQTAAASSSSASDLSIESLYGKSFLEIPDEFEVEDDDDVPAPTTRKAVPESASAQMAAAASSTLASAAEEAKKISVPEPWLTVLQVVASCAIVGSVVTGAYTISKPLLDTFTLKETEYPFSDQIPIFKVKIDVQGRLLDLDGTPIADPEQYLNDIEKNKPLVEASAPASAPASEAAAE